MILLLNVDVSTGDEISVYVYSSPQFVGAFKVQEENDSMYIEGLESVLKTMNLEIGTQSFGFGIRRTNFRICRNYNS